MDEYTSEEVFEYLSQFSSAELLDVRAILSNLLTEGSPTGRKRKISPPGESWCNTCKQHLPENEFSKGSRWNGRKTDCKNCYNVYKKSYKKKEVEK